MSSSSINSTQSFDSQITLTDPEELQNDCYEDRLNCLQDKVQNLYRKAKEMMENSSKRQSLPSPKSEIKYQTETEKSKQSPTQDKKDINREMFSAFSTKTFTSPSTIKLVPPPLLYDQKVGSQFKDEILKAIQQVETIKSNALTAKYEIDSNMDLTKASDTSLYGSDSLFLGNCQYNGTIYNGCNIDNIIKENDYLHKRISKCNNDLKMEKKRRKAYKKLSKLIYKKYRKCDFKIRNEKDNLGCRLDQIKRILDSTFALPPLPETCEVYKSMSLFLLENLETTEKRLLDTDSMPKYSDLRKEIPYWSEEK